MNAGILKYYFYIQEWYYKNLSLREEPRHNHHFQNQGLRNNTCVDMVGNTERKKHFPS